MLSTTNATTIGSATHGEAWIDCTSPRPKERNTPATIAMTIGMGSTRITRPTHPLRPSSRMSTAVTMNAPNTSLHGRWRSAVPTTTVPGIVQKNPSGWR